MSISRLINGEDVPFIAQKLLGSVISSELEGIKTSGIIVETEAYKAPDDKGSHAYGNKRTKRTETLYANAGTTYVYLCYGIHHLVNIVTGPINKAHAVLIRAIEPIAGMESMLSRRKMKNVTPNMTNGPGKLSQALGITTHHDGYQIFSDDVEITLNPGPCLIKKEDIICSPRVGIAYAQECAHWPWRFRIKDNPWTSLPHKVSYDAYLSQP